MGNILPQSHKPYVVYTKDGDYFFNSKKKAQAFAKTRCGFFDKSSNKRFTELLREHLKEVMP